MNLRVLERYELKNTGEVRTEVYREIVITEDDMQQTVLSDGLLYRDGNVFFVPLRIRR